MSEPKVEFDLGSMKDQEVREQFDQFRRWYEFREDAKTPSMQCFNGFLEPGTEINLYIPGVIYGVSGMTTYTSGGFWAPMTYSTTLQIGHCYFGAGVDNINGDHVRVVSNAASGITNEYRITILYRSA